MANPTVPKRSDVAGKVPQPKDLKVGEIATNTKDGKLFLKLSNGIIKDMGSGGGGGVSSWNDLTDKPSTFPPSSHNHAISDVNGLQDLLDTYVLTTDPRLNEEVFSYDTTLMFPAVGSTSALYYTTDDGHIFFWTGSVYAECGTQSTPTTLTKTRKFDMVSNVSYTGQAPLGTATNSSLWLIKKTTINTDGTVASTVTASNVAWDNRYSVTYS